MEGRYLTNELVAAYYFHIFTYIFYVRLKFAYEDFNFLILQNNGFNS